MPVLSLFRTTTPMFCHVMLPSGCVPPKQDPSACRVHTVWFHGFGPDDAGETDVPEFNAMYTNPPALCCEFVGRINVPAAKAVPAVHGGAALLKPGFDPVYGSNKQPWSPGLSAPVLQPV